jgi:hypothetical protein
VPGVAAALIIGCSEYADGDLSQLRAPAQDAERLAGVLADPAIGGFGVKTLLNQPAHVLNLAVEDFFADRDRDDLLLLYVSCHGVKDDDGRLYFAANDTRLTRLGATAVAAAFVNDKMSTSWSRRIVLLLDCCYSGAFPRGFLTRGDKRVDIKERFGGRGRAVITASSAMEYSFEGDRLTGKGMQSVFTNALIKGLETGEADLDLDGRVSVDELYDYVFEKVHDETPKQTPGKWITDVQGKLYIATARPRELPTDLRRAVESRSPTKRMAAVPELARILDSGAVAHSTAARRALEKLRDDDSRAVSGAATAALEAAADSKTTPAADLPSPRSRTRTWPRIAAWAAALGLIGLSVLGLQRLQAGDGQTPTPSGTALPTTTHSGIPTPSSTAPTVARSTSPQSPPVVVGDKNLTGDEQRLLGLIPAFFVGGGTCSRVANADDPRDIYPGEAAANLQCQYAGGAAIVYSLFQSDVVMHRFFDDRLLGRGLTYGEGMFGPSPNWQLNYCRDPARGTGQIYGNRNTRPHVDKVRVEIGWIQDGYQTYAYAYRPTDDFSSLYDWWRKAYGQVDTHRC